MYMYIHMYIHVHWQKEKKHKLRYLLHLYVSIQLRDIMDHLWTKPGGTVQQCVCVVVELVPKGAFT